jgi:predicted permease
MENLVLLAACFALGIVLRRSGRFPDNTPVVLNGFVVYISLPALTLYYVHGVRFEKALLMPALMPWLLFGAGLVFFWLVARMLRLPRRTAGCLMLVGSLGNTSFVGLPMIESFYGPGGLGTGIIVDQLGSYLALSTVGIVVAGLYASSGTQINAKAIALKVAKFPPFVAMVLAFALMPWAYPQWLDGLLQRVGLTLAPIALVSVGFQLRLSQLEGKLAPLAAGLGFKLMIGPLVMLALLALFFDTGNPHFRVTVFEAAMAPMIGATIVAMEHDLDRALAPLMVGIGIPLSFLTLPAWYQLLEVV